MRHQRAGSIVNVASDAAKVATPGETLIGAGHGGHRDVLSRCCARSQARRHPRQPVDPVVDRGTPGATLIAGEPFSARMFEKAAAMAHLGVAEATDLAAMAVFLAGPAARRITGQAIQHQRRDLGGLSTPPDHNDKTRHRIAPDFPVEPTNQETSDVAVSEIKTLGDIPRHYARTLPGKPALIDASGSTSFAALDAASNRVANALLARGVAPALAWPSWARTPRATSRCCSA